jgi:hypothetical protein
MADNVLYRDSEKRLSDMARFIKFLALAAVVVAVPLTLRLANEPAIAEQPQLQTTATQAAAPAAQKPQRPLIQIGPWYPATANIEEAYINIVHASRSRWNTDRIGAQELLDTGVIDKETGLPTRLPDGQWLSSEVYFTGDNPVQKLHWDGEWVLEWEGDADLWMQFMPNELQWKASKNRLEFTRDFKGGKTPYHAAIQIRRLKGPLKALRMYRKENETALKAGKIFNPKFARQVARYDVVRTMDLQGANTNAVRSVDDLPGPNAPHWANGAWQNEGNVNFPFRSAPLDAMVALAMETDTALWTTVPITLGNPIDLFDLSVRRDASDQWAGTYRAKTRENIDAVMNSPEWDRYADAFVAALVDKGYPQDRPLYVTIANEVWNFAGQYFLTTQYAMGVAEGLKRPLGLNEANYRHGYGIVSARWKMALDAALARAERKQNVVYVIEGQAVWADTTSWALEGAKRWLESKDERWEDHAPAFGVSVASYWGAGEAYGALSDKEGLQPETIAAALAGYVIDSKPSPKAHGSKNAVIEDFRQHARYAAKYGVRLVGAYEGGSHLERAEPVSWDAYKAFLWGEEGARANRAVNDALAAEFPGIILSNYVLAGPTGGQPWFEGPLGADNPYARSWEPYLRPARPDAD